MVRAFFDLITTATNSDGADRFTAHRGRKVCFSRNRLPVASDFPEAIGLEPGLKVVVLHINRVAHDTGCRLLPPTRGLLPHGIGQAIMSIPFESIPWV